MYDMVAVTIVSMEMVLLFKRRHHYSYAIYGNKCEKYMKIKIFRLKMMMTTYTMYMNRTEQSK